MKKILMTIFVMLLSLNLFAEDLNGPKVLEFPGIQKTVLFEQSLQWLAGTFKSSKAVIEYQNKQEGKIIGNVLLSCGMMGKVFAKLTIEIKNFKVRLTCVPTSMTGMNGSNEFPYNTLLNSCFNKDVTILFEEYNQAMKNSKNTSEW